MRQGKEGKKSRKDREDKDKKKSSRSDKVGRRPQAHSGVLNLLYTRIREAMIGRDAEDMKSSRRKRKENLGSPQYRPDIETFVKTRVACAGETLQACVVFAG